MVTMSSSRHVQNLTLLNQKYQVHAMYIDPLRQSITRSLVNGYDFDLNILLVDTLISGFQTSVGFGDCLVEDFIEDDVLNIQVEEFSDLDANDVPSETRV